MPRWPGTAGGKSGEGKKKEMEHIKQEEHQSYVSNHMESICKSDALSAFAWWKTDQ